MCCVHRGINILCPLVQRRISCLGSPSKRSGRTTHRHCKQNIKIAVLNANAARMSPVLVWCAESPPASSSPSSPSSMTHSWIVLVNRGSTEKCQRCTSRTMRSTTLCVIITTPTFRTTQKFQDGRCQIGLEEVWGQLWALGFDDPEPIQSESSSARHESLHPEKHT